MDSQICSTSSLAASVLPVRLVYIYIYMYVKVKPMGSDMEYMSVCMYVYMTCKVKPITGLMRLISLSRLQSPSSRMIRCSYYSSVRHHRCHSVRSVGQLQSLPFTPACWDGDYMLLSMRVTQNYTGLTYTAGYHSSVSATLMRRRLSGGGGVFCGVSGSVSDSR